MVMVMNMIMIKTSIIIIYFVAFIALFCALMLMLHSLIINYGVSLIEFL